MTPGASLPDRVSRREGRDLPVYRERLVIRAILPKTGPTYAVFHPKRLIAQMMMYKIKKMPAAIRDVRLAGGVVGAVGMLATATGDPTRLRTMMIDRMSTQASDVDRSIESACRNASQVAEIKVSLHFSFSAWSARLSGAYTRG